VAAFAAEIGGPGRQTLHRFGMQQELQQRTRPLKLILARHGNTFGPGDRVVWIGVREDLPLVESGRTQAEHLLTALLGAQIVPACVWHGTLRRAADYGAILAAGLGVVAVGDPRLDEIDYGAWRGLSNEEIEARFGGHELSAWQERSVWPASAGFQPPEAIVRNDVRSFVADLLAKEDEVALAVSSSGRLRYFLELVPGELGRRLHDQSFRVRTGSVGALVYESDRWRVAYWNVEPTAGFVP
jgi:probable phosphoglycerate mutase